MIGAVEQETVDRIAAANAAGDLGYQLKTVKSYGNELDEELGRIAVSFPAVWVVYVGERPVREQTKGHWLMRMSWSIVAATLNRRNEAATRRGDAGNVGSYQIVDDLKALLLGQDLGLDIQPFKPAGVRSLAQGKTPHGPVSIYALQLTADYTAELADQTGAHDFALLHSDWDLPPHVVAPTVPLDPADADATDDTAMETK